MTLDDDFEVFWQQYPRRIGKLAAKKAYRKARTMANAKELLDGITRYIAHKPAYADYCHPVTFLHQGRWLDEPDTPKAARIVTPCPHQPRCESTWKCGRKQQAEL